MLSASNEFKDKIKENRHFTIRGTIKFEDATTHDLVADDIIKNGFCIKDSTSESGKFTIGGCVIGELTLMLNNHDGRFDLYNFDGGNINIQTGLELSETTEWLNHGTFYVSSSKAVGSCISITAYDGMAFLDKKWETSLTFPTNALAILNECCTNCNLILNTQIGADYTIEAMPEDEMTCREVVAYFGQIFGCFAKINNQGYLEFKWYDMSVLPTIIDGGNFNDYSSGATIDGGNFDDYTSGDNVDGGTFDWPTNYHYFYNIMNPEINTDDTKITGVSVNGQMVGTDGYVVVIEDNPFVQSENKALLTAFNLMNKLSNLNFRALKIKSQSAPYVEAGDVCLIADNKGNVYSSFISNLELKLSTMDISCDAESKDENNTVRFNPVTKIIQKSDKETEKKFSAYELMVNHLANLMMQSLGVFPSGQKQEDGSTIFYMHDKPTLEESQKIWKMTADALAVSSDGGATWNAGIDVNGNAVMNVLSVIGLNAEWMKTGEISGITMIFENGRIANMEVRPNGLFLTNEGEYDNFVIETPYSKIDYNMLGLSMSTERRIAGILRKMNIDMIPDSNLRVGISDEYGVSLGTITIGYDDNGFPKIDIITSQLGEPSENIFVNDMNVIRRLKQVDTNTSDIYAIKLRLGML